MDIAILHHLVLRAKVEVVRRVVLPLERRAVPADLAVLDEDVVRVARREPAVLVMVAKAVPDCDILAFEEHPARVDAVRALSGRRRPALPDARRALVDGLACWLGDRQIILVAAADRVADFDVFYDDVV